MRLIHTTSCSLEEFIKKPKVEYAVLSHRWRDGEITFSDFCLERFRRNQGFSKLHHSLKRAREDGFRYLWIDSCCINRESSAELSEAINFMYDWYGAAGRCYVYLHDFDLSIKKASLGHCEWFKRGWTLQELLAPSDVHFYDKNWQFVGTRQTLADRISQITGITLEALEAQDLSRFSVAQKMSWASKRRTTRPEDEAYCLMGIFGVNMPLLYGEGSKAFVRLQEEIIKDSDDQSIFSWSMGQAKCSGLLASSPACFANCGQVSRSLSPEGNQPFSMTNRGLSIKLSLTPWSADTYLGYLDCTQAVADQTVHTRSQVCILLRRLFEDDQYARINLAGRDIVLERDIPGLEIDRLIFERRLYVRKCLDPGEDQKYLQDAVYGLQIPRDWLPSSSNIILTHPSPDKHITSLPEGGWGQVMTIDLPRMYKGLRRITVGFDIDFNLVCVLENSSTGQYVGSFDWAISLQNNASWCMADKRGRIFKAKHREGILAVQAHRRKGVNFLIPAFFAEEGLLVSMERNGQKHPLIWELDIDNLVGPFRNFQHKQIKRFWGSRRNFQAAYGLKMTNDDLDEGDRILATMCHPDGSFNDVAA